MAASHRGADTDGMRDPVWPDIMRHTGLEDGEYPLVAQLLLFRNLDLATIADLLHGARVVTYDRGDTLFNRGDPADRLFAVVDGWVKLTRTTPDGQESVIGVFGRGQSFAEAAIFQGGRYPVTGVFVEHTRLLVIPAQRFLAKLRERPDTLLNMLAAMSRHLHDLVQQVEQLSTRTTVERVAGFFASLTGAGELPQTFRLPHDKALIAGRLGMRPETFSRALLRLRAYGVEERGAMIHVRDPKLLRRLSLGEHDGR
jgi:CRP-like cAMP-binding protein